MIEEVDTIESLSNHRKMFYYIKNLFYFVDVCHLMILVY